MPFDGFILASRVMVAKEAHSSPGVKDLIVAAKGVDDAQWEGTYAKETGGILTVRSELGEPIHKVANRAVKLWKEFDNTVFNLPKEKRAAWLAERKSEVIAKLNKDFSKPWFGWEKDGRVVEDIADMTYEEVVLRMIRLMYVGHEERWIDVSLRNLTGDWLRRVEERFAGVNGGGPKPSILQSYTSLDKPTNVVQDFFKKYPAATEQLLASEDKAYFLAISQRPGQKPAPFIPILDANFEAWFKKDSLWAAEDLEAVFDQDPQHFRILQGPVAVKHAVVKDEPIKDLLGNIVTHLAQKLLERSYGGDISKVPSIDYLGARPLPLPETIAAELGTVPETSLWLETLAGPRLDWVRALLITPNVVQGSNYVDNPMRRLFAPRPNQRAVVETTSDGVPTSLILYGSARSFGEHKSDFKAVEAHFNAAKSQIDLTLYEDREDASVPLFLHFEYKPSQGFAPMHKVAGERNTRIKDFYWRLRFGDNETLPTNLNVCDTFAGPEVTIDAVEVEDFCSVIENQGEAFKTTRNAEVQPPMDFAIVMGWQAIMNSGDVCRNEGHIQSVVITDACKAVKVKGTIFCNGKPVVEVVSAFLYRGRFRDFENTFKVIEEPTTSYNVAFVGMVLPGDELKVNIKHTSPCTPAIWSSRLRPLTSAADGTAEIAQLEASTVYVFTGQDSQEPGMDMELYNRRVLHTRLRRRRSLQLGSVLFTLVCSNTSIYYYICTLM
ncbi:hypothetical protein BXZ70DRAFT_1011826 [Cristinia sonorae]|uniref:Uncharacterized protein n=1 Tax=Cristinia sonorae TaxID=1940300 RepID=A0A8K0UFQ4_9AGAR|nr:hypothetical protein BXZ70DRAFT_1011826 [Cristinia sonorae]